MNEEEFDASLHARPFGTVEVAKAEFQLRRSIALGIALWGKSPEDLKRQLVAPYPQIPSGFDLNDFQNLQHHVQTISASLGDSRFSFLPRSVLSPPDIFVGAQRFTTWEARCEIVRRAIDYLESR